MEIEPIEITTVIPTYHRPLLLKRALLSVLDQTYPHVRACVFDNASDAETRQMVQELADRDPRVSYFGHPENIGLIPNFAYGISHVETPFFSLLSDDDYLLPDFYQTALAALRDAPTAMLFVGNALIRDEMKQIVHATSRRMTAPGVYQPPVGLMRLLREDTLRLWTGMVFQTEAVRHLGNLDAALATQHDHDFVVRMAMHYPLVISNQPCAMYLRHATATHVTDRPGDSFWHGWFDIIDKVANDPTLAPDVRQPAARALSRKIGADVRRAAIRAVAADRWDEARSLAAMLERDGPTLVSRLINTAADKSWGRAIMQKACATVLRLRNTLSVARGKIRGISGGNAVSPLDASRTG